jgi:tRNA(Ile)-lysidine synthase
VTNRQATSHIDAFQRALDNILARVSTSTPADETVLSIAVAYSGGLDSSVLLHLAHDYAKTKGIALHAFHVHHGLSPNADQWLAHCERECASLGVPFDARRVELQDMDMHGVEQAARIARYAALGQLCRAHEARLLLTGHHQDDQAETVLLQLLRGSGVAGLSGMEVCNRAPDLMGDPDILLGRPLLTVARAELEDVVKQRGISHVEDESNHDPRYARNALRQKIMPVLAEYFPGFQRRVVRSALHAQSAQHLLTELAAQDYACCAVDDCIDIDSLRQLDEIRVTNVLRHWFAARGLRMPSTAWIDELRVQLFEAKDDARIRVTHADCEIRRHRGRIFITPRRDDEREFGPVEFTWRGENKIYFAEHCGSLEFITGAEGVPVEWLLGLQLLLRRREGGERLKRAANRPRRSLKHHYQALGIPAWERDLLPLVFAGGQLLFAAGIGMNCLDVATEKSPRVCLRWTSDAR